MPLVERVRGLVVPGAQTEVYSHTCNFMNKPDFCHIIGDISWRIAESEPVKHPSKCQQLTNV